MGERVDSRAHRAHPATTCSTAHVAVRSFCSPPAPSPKQHLTRPPLCRRCAAACRAWTSPARPAPPSTCASTTSAACWTLKTTWPAGRCASSLLPIWHVGLSCGARSCSDTPVHRPKQQSSCGSNLPLLPILRVQFQRDLAAGCSPETEFLTGARNH